MAGWLPEDFGEDLADARASWVATRVKLRADRRAKRVRVVRWTAGAVFVTVLAFVLAPKVSRHELHPGDSAVVASRAAGPEKVMQGSGGAEGQGSKGMEPESQGAREPGSGSPHPPISPSPHHEPTEVTLAKAASGVKLNWQGDSSKEYVVYRCTTPTFTQCSTAGEVKGTQWTDREADAAPLVFYKVEPKA